MLHFTRVLNKYSYNTLWPMKGPYLSMGMLFKIFPNWYIFAPHNWQIYHIILCILYTQIISHCIIVWWQKVQMSSSSDWFWNKLTSLQSFGCHHHFMFHSFVGLAHDVTLIFQLTRPNGKSLIPMGKFENVLVLHVLHECLEFSK